MVARTTNPKILEAVRREMRVVRPKPQAVPKPQVRELFLRAAVRSEFVAAEIVEEVAHEGDSLGTMEADLAALLEQSRRVKRRRGQQPAWELDEVARRECLESFYEICGRDSVRFVKELQRRLPRVVQAEDSLQRMLSAYVRGQSRPLNEQTVEELAASQRVAEWMKGLLPELPTVETVRAARKKGELLAPFHLLAQHFRGRERELSELREYVEWFPAEKLSRSIARAFRTFFDLEEKPPFVLHGMGGAGKTTLVAQFVLQHLTSSKEGQLPFIYIDFDQPGISLQEPLTFLLEGVRQLALQFPEHADQLEQFRTRWQRELAHIADALRRENATNRRAGNVAASYIGSHSDEQGDSFSDFANLWETMAPASSPLLMVLDSFEEAQSRSSSLLPGLFSLLQRWSSRIPRLRVVVVGRAEVTEFPTESLAVGDLDTEASMGFLHSHGVLDEALARYIGDRFGRNPLTLQLAAAVVRREGSTAREILDEVRVRNLFHVRVNALRVQQELVRRNLTHLHDSEVEKLAMPGLVVRRISAKIIQEVLAGPCGLGPVTSEHADKLFAKLRSEVSIVTQADESDAVRYRTDLRRALLPLVTSEEPVRSREIHDAAVRFYEKFDDPASRAEEIYHRLSRGDPNSTVTDRIVPGVDNFLGSALSELPSSAHVFLANRFGWSVPAEVKQAAELSAWEEAEARDLQSAFASGARAALEASARRLEARDERTDRSVLFPLEAILYERLGQFQKALRSAEVALGLVDNKEAGQDSWTLLMTMGRLAQRLGDWDLARRYLRRAMSAGERADKWELVARAGVELLRVDGRSSGRRFPRRLFRKAARIFRENEPLPPGEASGSDILLSLATVEDARLIRRILEAPGMWRANLLSGPAFQELITDLLKKAGDDEQLGKLTLAVFQLRYRQFGRVPGEIGVKVFDVVQFAETTFTLDTLRAHLHHGPASEAADSLHLDLLQ